MASEIRQQGIGLVLLTFICPLKEEIKVKQEQSAANPRNPEGVIRS